MLVTGNVPNFNVKSVLKSKVINVLGVSGISPSIVVPV
jgi:hypothetical protein